MVSKQINADMIELFFFWFWALLRFKKHVENVKATPKLKIELHLFFRKLFSNLSCALLSWKELQSNSINNSFSSLNVHFGLNWMAILKIQNSISLRKLLAYGALVQHPKFRLLKSERTL